MTIETERRQRFYKSFEARALESRSFLTNFADDLTAIFGSTPFLILNAIFFAVWMGINLNLLPMIPLKPFDPFPFGLLTMIVSLEAIFLSIFVLVSQNRSSYVDTLREELHLQVNLIAEGEITKVLKVLAEVREKVGIREKDEELEKMIERIDTNYIEKSLIAQMTKANKPLAQALTKGLSQEFPDIINPISTVEKVVKAVQNAQTKPSKS